MKSKIKRIILLTLCVVSAGCSAVLTGCGSDKTEKESVTVEFIQDGETKEQITVERGKKIDEESVPAPSAERENCVTEWNFDFDLPVSKNTTADTVTYTRRLSFSKSLKGDYYLAAGYNGETPDLYMPDYYKGMPVSSIQAEAFRGNQTIVTVRFPSTLLSVANGAFKSCNNLTSAMLPDTVTAIGSSAFEDCTSLTEFRIPPLIKTITSRMAQGHKYDFLALPEGVTVIESYAFASHMSSIVLPRSLKRIENVGIWANLRKIYYAGSEFEWQKVNVSSEPYTGTGGFTFSAKSITTEIATLYFYSEEKPARPGNYWHYVSGEITIWE